MPRSHLCQAFHPTGVVMGANLGGFVPLHKFAVIRMRG